MVKEAAMLETQPPPQCTAWRIHEQINHWHARQSQATAQTQRTQTDRVSEWQQITSAHDYLPFFVVGCGATEIRGPADTPYEGGHFKLELRVPDRSVARAMRRCLNAAKSNADSVSLVRFVLVLQLSFRAAACPVPHAHLSSECGSRGKNLSRHAQHAAKGM